MTSAERKLLLYGGVAIGGLIVIGWAASKVPNAIDAGLRNMPFPLNWVFIGSEQAAAWLRGLFNTAPTPPSTSPPATAPQNVIPPSTVDPTYL